MISLGNDEITKYPFLAEAGEYLKDKGFTLEQFATDPDLQIIVDKAYERVECASWGKIFNSTPDGSKGDRSEEHTSELQSLVNLVCRLLLEKKKKTQKKARVQYT